MSQSQRYVGSVILKAPDHGFIRLATLKKADGTEHGLGTSHDIFVHQDDCHANCKLRHDMEVSFEVVPDTRRDGDALRAVEVDELITGELVVTGEDAGECRAVVDPATLYVQPTPAQQARMKFIPPEAIREVLANYPMPLMSRVNAHVDDVMDFVRRLMRLVFPQFAAISDEAGGDIVDANFDEVIKAAVKDHQDLGMNDQGELMLRQGETYKALRSILQTDEDLLTPATIIPIKYLPDIFMAAPVWYFWTTEKERGEALEGRSGDRRVHQKTQDICDLVPGDRWTDTFLMFNRRMRTLPDYKGDIIPPKIIARMKKMSSLFDQLVISTPYCDVAGADWSDLAWQRSIDPYVLGFLKGIPFIFVLGRFSDSGIFPLHSELVADTIAFLRTNIKKLEGFDRVNQLYWYRHGKPGFCFNGSLGNKLIEHTKQLLVAFEKGYLFDWLREEEPKVPTKI